MWLPLAVFVFTISHAFGASLRNDDYITYYPGTLPIVLGAPHGGDIRPSEVPNRDAGCWDGSKCIWSHDCGEKDSSRCSATTVKDLNTKELTLLMRDELFAIYGEYPHVVINELHRIKLDANRLMDEATFGVPSMEEAWTTFHTYVNQSKAASQLPSLFFDIHGHGHALQWAELGYLLTARQLDENDFTPEITSIRRLADLVTIPFEDLLRGDESFGGILEEEGYASVPSPSKPGPDGNAYFSGGDNTRMHGSRSGGNTDAIQIESPSSFRSDSERPQYAKALARAIQRYMALHYGFTGNR